MHIPPLLKKNTSLAYNLGTPWMVSLVRLNLLPWAGVGKEPKNCRKASISHVIFHALLIYTYLLLWLLLVTLILWKVFRVGLSNYLCRLIVKLCPFKGWTPLYNPAIEGATSCIFFRPLDMHPLCHMSGHFAQELGLYHWPSAPSNWGRRIYLQFYNMQISWIPSGKLT
jgi:hypothetical protein